MALPLDTIAPNKTPSSVMPAQVQAQIAKEKEAEAARLKKAAEQKEKEAAEAMAREVAKKRADFSAITPDKDINLADPYGNKMPDYDSSGRAKMAEGLQAAGVKTLAGNLTDEARVKKYQDTIESGRVPENSGWDKVAYEQAKNAGEREPTEQEERIPDSQAAIDVKTPASSAGEIANASPSRVGAIIDKLKAEEKKGGPNFFDIIEAATAGWNGRIPMYVQKELAAKEQEEAIQRMQAGADIDAANYEQRQADELAAEKRRFSFDEAEAAKDRAFQLALKGGTVSDGVGSLGGLSASGFLGGQ